MSKDIVVGKGNGYIDSGGKICMVRCFACGKENYALAVSSGCCAWCGLDANAVVDKDKLNKETNDNS